MRLRLPEPVPTRRGSNSRPTPPDRRTQQHLSLLAKGRRFLHTLRSTECRATFGVLVIELSAVLDELRAELNRGRASAANESLQFEIGPIILDVTLTVTREAKGSGKINIWVLEFGGEGGASSQSTQRLTVTLTPVGVEMAPSRLRRVLGAPAAFVADIKRYTKLRSM